jgi:hypothetical protein
MDPHSFPLLAEPLSLRPSQICSRQLLKNSSKILDGPTQMSPWFWDVRTCCAPKAAATAERSTSLRVRNREARMLALHRFNIFPHSAFRHSALSSWPKGNPKSMGPFDLNSVFPLRRLFRRSGGGSQGDVPRRRVDWLLRVEIGADEIEMVRCRFPFQ